MKADVIVGTEVRWSDNHPTVIVRRTVAAGASISDYVRLRENRKDIMAEALSEMDFVAIQRSLERWVDDHPNPDDEIMYIGQDHFSPRDILNYFKEQRDPVAKIVNNVATKDFIEALDRERPWKR